MAPRGVPAPLLDKISKDWAAGDEDARDEVQARFAIPDRRDRYARGDGQIVKDETENLTKVFKEAGI